MYLLHARFWKLRIVRGIIFVEGWREFSIISDIEFRKFT